MVYELGKGYFGPTNFQLWNGKNAGQEREQWFYTDVYEIYGTDKTEAVAVKINNRYYIAAQK